MEKIKKLFGGIDLTWKKLIIFAIATAVYTALMAIIPITKDTSFRDIAATLEDRITMCSVAKPCPTHCNPVGCSSPGSSVRGILQTRILEWVAISSSRDLPDPGIEPRSPAL